MTERSWLGWDVSEAVQLWNIIATDLPLGVIGAGGSVEMVGQEAVGGKGSKGRHLLDSLWAIPSPLATTVGFRASWGTRKDLVAHIECLLHGSRS